jgi:hypothetical protein
MAGQYPQENRGFPNGGDPGDHSIGRQEEYALLGWERGDNCLC